MEYTRLAPLATILNLFPVWVSTATAQPQPPPSPPPASSTCGVIKSLHFPGGTLGDYVKTLEEVCPTANIMISNPEVLEIKLPPIKLQAVDFVGAVYLMEGKYAISDSLFAHIGIDVVGDFADSGGTPVYRVSMQHSGIPNWNSVRVWNIGELLDADRKAEDVLTAVETAVDLLHIKEKAQIKYHGATTLLVASGNDVQLQAIDRVVGGLREGLEHSRRRIAGVQQDELSALVARLKQSGEPDNKQILDLFDGFMQELSRRESKIKDLEQALQARDRK